MIYNTCIPNMYHALKARKHSPIALQGSDILIYVTMDQWHCKSQNYTDKFTKYNFLHENNSKALFGEILAISMWTRFKARTWQRIKQVALHFLTPPLLATYLTKSIQGINTKGILVGKKTTVHVCRQFLISLNLKII